ncbi:hypothetical protein IFR05_016086 [Cadophora sp. M221]|nr:hypothetical protein IFR05_016086 [Cadophora sp. M221]
MKQQLNNYLENVVAKSSQQIDEDQILDDLALTLGSRRSRFSWKSHVVASSLKNLSEALSLPISKPKSSSGQPQIAFVFTGQGAQWARMGLELMDYPVVKECLEAADAYLRNNLGADWSVITELEKSALDSNINLAKFSQPLCTIIQVALVDLFQRMNIQPTGVVGHSSGEIAAAYCFGAISREQAWEISYWRGKMSSNLGVVAPSLRGAMMAVGLSAEAAESYITRITKGRIVIACVNSPNSVTISGDEAGIIELGLLLNGDSVFYRKLMVEHAYHSHHMEPAATDYLEKLSHIHPRVSTDAPRMKMISSTFQHEVSYADLAPSYWVENMLSPVLFSPAVITLLQGTTQRPGRPRKRESDFDCVLEIGPHSALRGPLKQIFEVHGMQNITYISALARGQEATKTILGAVGTLFEHGATPTMSEINLSTSTPRHRVNLPSYPWNHSHTYWSESRISKNYRFRKYGHHDLLGAPAHDFNELEPKWRHFIRPSENPWITDHAINSSIIYPAAGTIALVLEAANQLSDKSRHVENFRFKDVQIKKAIVVPDDQYGVECILHMRRQRTESGAWTGWWDFSVYSCLQDQELEENAFGSITIEYRSLGSQSLGRASRVFHDTTKNSYQAAKGRCTTAIDVNEFYNTTSALGLKYGPLFQGLTEIQVGKDDCCCTVEIPNTKASMPSQVQSTYIIHPTTLDIMFQPIFAALGGIKLDLRNAAVPVSFDRIVISADVPSTAGTKLSGFCNTKRDGPNSIIADIYMSDILWEKPQVQISGIRCRELPRDDVEKAAVAPFGTLLWKPDIDLIDDQSLCDYAATKSSSQTSVTDSICKVVALAAHKNPDLSILQVGISSEDFMSSLLSTLKGSSRDTVRYSSYVVADFDRARLDQATKLSEKWNADISFKVLNPEKGMESLGIPAKSLDMIIVSAGLHPVSERGSFVHNACTSLEEGGKLLITDSADQLCRQSWVKAIADCCLIPMGDSIPTSDENKSLFIARKPLPEQSYAVERIHILQHAGMTTLDCAIASQITMAFSKLGITSEHITWPPDGHDSKDKHIISVLELTSPFLTSPSPEDFNILKSVVKQSSSLLWVSRGENPAFQAVLGYFRTLRNEDPGLTLRSLHLEDRDSRCPEEIADVIAHVAVMENTDSEFMEMNGRLCINRWVGDEGMTSMAENDGSDRAHGYLALENSLTPLKLVQGLSGSRTSYFFTVDDSVRDELGEYEVEMEVKAVVLNSTNVKENQQDFTAKAYGGIVKRNGGKASRFNIGDRICCASPGPYRTILRSQANVCVGIPNKISTEEATSWPLIYATAYHGLVNMANLRPGIATLNRALGCLTEVPPRVSVLIQDAASAVGQAAIQICLNYGADVFATIRTEEQNTLVENLGVPTENILREDDPNLKAAIDILSCGHGMDIVLKTSSRDESSGKLWRCTASNGVFIDTASSGPTNSSALDMGPFKRGARFMVLDMDVILRDNLALASDIMRDISISLRSYSFNPVTPSSIFPASEVSSAFHQSTAAEGAGQTTITFSLRDKIPVSCDAQNQLLLRSDSTYVLVGGLGGLGRSLVTLLAENGARHLVTISRSGAESIQAKDLIEKLSNFGVSITAYACDVSDEASLKSAIATMSQNHPPIRGVIQSAAVIRDSIYDNMTHTQWEESIKPKIHGSWALHKLLPEDMDFFVMLSSISGVFGNRSQANYAAGNTFQDALAEYRINRGLPAVSVDLGLMLDIGMVAEGVTKTGIKTSEAVGISEDEFRSLMKVAISSSFAGKRVPTQIICGLPTGGMLQKSGLEEPFYFTDPRFQMLKKTGVAKENDRNTAALKLSIGFRLSQISSIQDASEIISLALCERVAKGLQTAVANIDVSKPLHSYGIDSLMATDIRNWVVVNIKTDISLLDVLSGNSISAMALKIANLSKFVPQNRG